MKLRAGEARQFLARPDPARGGCLVHGADPELVRLLVAGALAALLGPDAESEMRLTRLSAAALRSDPSTLQDALRAAGFFPGARAVVIDGAGDALAPLVSDALNALVVGEDAFLMVTSDALPARSKLRKAFESHPVAVAAPIYAEAPDHGSVSAQLAQAGLADVMPDALDDLVLLARDLDIGAFRQFLERLSLFKLSTSDPVSSDDVAQCAAGPGEAQFGLVIDAMAEGRVADIGPGFNRLAAQGVQPTALCIASARHFRQLYTLATAADGADRAIARARPPVFGPRRDAMLRQVRGWGPARLEWALGVLSELDLALRSSPSAPAPAMTERTFVRLAMQRARN